MHVYTPKTSTHGHPSIPRIFRNGVTNILFTNSSALLKNAIIYYLFTKIYSPWEKNTKLPPSDLIHLIVHLKFPLRATSGPNDH